MTHEKRHRRYSKFHVPGREIPPGGQGGGPGEKGARLPGAGPHGPGRRAGGRPPAPGAGGPGGGSGPGGWGQPVQVPGGEHPGADPPGQGGHGGPGAAPAGGRGGPPGRRRQPGQPPRPGQRLRDRPPGGGEPGAGPGRVRDRADPGLKAALCGGEPPRRPPVPGRHFRGGGHRPSQRVGGAHRLPGAAGGAEEPQDRRPGPGGLQRRRVGTAVFPGPVRRLEKRGRGPGVRRGGEVLPRRAGPGVRAVPGGQRAPARPLRGAERHAGGHRQRLGARGGVLPLRGGEVPVPPHQPEPGAAGRDLRRAFFGRPGRHLRDSALLPRGLGGAGGPLPAGPVREVPKAAGLPPHLRPPGGRGPLPGLHPGGGGRLLKGGGGAAVQGPQRGEAEAGPAGPGRPPCRRGGGDGAAL